MDPDGEAIQLNGSEDERERLLEAIRQAVGKKAAKYLYENKVTDKDGTTRYFVGILDGGPTGKGKDFKDMNKVGGRNRTDC
jgi:hypothetical protein